MQELFDFPETEFFKRHREIQFSSQNQTVVDIQKNETFVVSSDTGMVLFDPESASLPPPGMLYYNDLHIMTNINLDTFHTKLKWDGRALSPDEFRNAFLVSVSQNSIQVQIESDNENGMYEYEFAISEYVIFCDSEKDKTFVTILCGGTYRDWTVFVSGTSNMERAYRQEEQYASTILQFDGTFETIHQLHTNK